MALVRESAGRYKDPATGKIYPGKTLAEAQAAYNKANVSNNTTSSAGPVNLVDQKNGTFKDAATGKIYPGANIKDAQRAYNAEKLAAKQATNAPAPTPSPLKDAKDLEKNLGAAPKTPAELAADNKIIADQAAKDAIKAANPGEQTDIYGNKKTTTVDANGNVITKEQLGAAEQKLLDQDNAISTGAKDTALNLQDTYNFQQGFNPQLAQRTSTGDLSADRARIEDAVYAKLTKDTESDFARERDQNEQTLRNRGIPLGSELYDHEMKKLNDRYQGIKDSARQQAIVMGGDEYSRDFGINEQLIANQLNQQQGIRNQQIGEVGTFASMGTGLHQSNLSPYQGVNYQTPTGTENYGAVTGAQQNEEALKIQKAQADAAIAKMRQGSGGSKSTTKPTTQAPSPFVNSTLPGA